MDGRGFRMELGVVQFLFGSNSDLTLPGLECISASFQSPFPLKVNWIKKEGKEPRSNDSLGCRPRAPALSVNVSLLWKCPRN